MVTAEEEQIHTCLQAKAFYQRSTFWKNGLGQWEQFQRNVLKWHCARAGQERLQNQSKRFALYTELWLTGIQNEGGAGQLERLEGHCHPFCYGTFSLFHKDKGIWYYKPLPFARYVSACLVRKADVLFFSSITAQRTALWILLVSVNITGKYHIAVVFCHLLSPW